jgi:hypothetical protein
MRHPQTTLHIRDSIFDIEKQRLCVRTVVVKVGAGADLARHLDTDARMKLTG